jgi:CRISPR-associated protein Cas1
MSNVYIISDHGKLIQSNETLEFTAADGKVRKIFPHKMDSLIIGGIVSISGRAFRLLIKHQINTLFISSNGKYNGKLIFNTTKNVFLRKKQYILSDDGRFALPIAKSIVLAKVRNELTFIQRIKRKTDSETEFSRVIQSLKTTIGQIDAAENIEEIRGYEGMAAKHYFSVFRHNLIPDWAQFPRRSKNPPQSNVNAVLSFLYTLLMYRIETAIEFSGLDAMAGFLHATEYGKNALVFDLTEEFRTPIVDTLCCALFNHNVLSPELFHTVTGVEDTEVDSSEDEGERTILLTNEGLKIVIPAFEKRMETLVYYPPLETQLSLDMIIIEQVKQLKRVILGDEKAYKGYLYK